MAYAAVVYLRQLLEEEFIQFLCRTLEFGESKIKDFHLRVNNVLDKFKTPQHFPLTLLAEIQEYFRLLAPTIADVDLIDEAALFDKVLLNDRIILNRIPYIMDKLDDINSSLGNFVGHPISSSVTGDSSAILAQKSCTELANNLLSLNKEYQLVVSSLNVVAEEAISLHDRLGTLLLKVKDSNDEKGVNWIKVVSGNVGDQIEDFLTGYPFLMEKIDVVALMEIKRIIGDLRQIIDQFESNTLQDLPLGGESQLKPENSVRSQLQRPQRWLHKLQHLFCIRAEYGEDDTSPKDSWLSSFPGTKSLQIHGPGLLKDSRELSHVLSQIEGSRKSSPKREEIVMGLDDDMTKIVTELTRPPSRLSIVTIAGMGGIGKTTLAQKVFRHPITVYHFHLIAWVNSISSTDQVLSHLLNSVVMTRNEMLGQSSEEDSEFFPDEIDGQSSEDKGESLWRSLRKRRYLIVVDDLWNFDAWNAIQRYFPDDKVGSRILITSRSMEFPTCIPNNPPHCMRLLNKNQSWEMLEKLVFGEESCPFELVAIGKLIARKCGGLRLAIVVIAGTLLSIPRSDTCWSCVMDNINSIVSNNPERCLDILALSYNYLPPHLKTCFLFMGSFPANCEIDVQKLLSLWIAEGFLDSKSSNPSEKVAEDYLEDLICRSLVLVGQRSFDGKIKTCSIHELLRQFCLREAYKEDFMQVLPADTTGQGIVKQHRLIFNSINDTDLLLLPSLPHLRSFILLTPGFDISQDVLVSQISCCKWLRVLDMYFLPLGTFPTEILDLVNLRYLAINITYVIDASISRLWKLQTLVIYGPWIPRVGRQLEYLPTVFFDYWKMPWLRNVSVRVPCFFRYCYLPQRLRDGYPVPSNLQTLSTIKFSSCREEVFFLMPKLKKLGVHETKEDYEKGEYKRCFENLPSLTELEILKCSFYKGIETATRSLCLDVLPVKLKRLTLCGSCLSWDQMELLASLPKLETLKLKDYAFRGGVWNLSEVVFGRLKQLLIDRTDLVYWEAEGTDNFPRLEYLVLRSCKSLLDIPFEAFPALVLIDVHNCSQLAENSAKEFQEQFGCLNVAVTDRTRAVEKGGQSIEYEY